MISKTCLDEKRTKTLIDAKNVANHMRTGWVVMVSNCGETSDCVPESQLGGTRLAVQSDLTRGN
jgi:hypothetical protein